MYTYYFLFNFLPLLYFEKVIIIRILRKKRKENLTPFCTLANLETPYSGNGVSKRVPIMVYKISNAVTRRF